MKYLLVADLHLRIKPYKEDIEYSRSLLREIESKAIKNHANIIFLGDVWDTKGCPEPEVLFLLMEFFERLQTHLISTYWIIGNHECISKRNAKESIARIFKSPSVSIVDDIFCIPRDKCILWLVAWHAQDEMIKVLENVHVMNEQMSQRACILSHIGIKEGKTANNFHLNCKVSIKHFMPEKYDYILLGDYHKEQEIIPEKAYYLGSPIQLQHGDAWNNKIWLLSWEEQRWKLTSEELDNIYPRYLQYTVNHLTEMEDILENTRDMDHVRLHVEASIAQHVKNIMPKAEIVAFTLDGSVEGEDRLACTKIDDPYNVLMQVLKLSKMDGRKYKVLGKEFLNRATDLLL